MAKSRRLESSLPLYPYQLRWVEDDSRYKIACKARQIGFSFAATFRVVQRRRRLPGLTVWLSASVRQALEAMEYVRHHLRVQGLVARFQDGYIEGTEIRQQQIRLPNGSRIVALPANPDTVRGFAGDIVLDEFAFHRDDEAIWRAAFATATRGYQIEIISTPNGARGKYYELARAAGLVDFSPPPLANRASAALPAGGHGFSQTPSQPSVDPERAQRVEGSEVEGETQSACLPQAGFPRSGSIQTPPPKWNGRRRSLRHRRRYPILGGMLPRSSKLDARHLEPPLGFSFPLPRRRLRR